MRMPQQFQQQSLLVNNKWHLSDQRFSLMAYIY